MNEICWSCRRGQHNGCAALITDTVCDCTHDNIVQAPPVGTIGNALNLDTEEPDTRKITRRLKNDDAVTDQQSTGRKRAAALYPLKDANGNSLPCDYANLPAPTLPNYMEVQIDGCGIRKGTVAGKAQARHHHDYNTLNNERSNVALLCHSCHNLLHAKNDEYKDAIYERIYGFKPAVEDLKHANKALKSGIVGGGQIKAKDEFNL